ncbi:flagellar hook-length control protein FliK [Ferrovum sp.]|uniref:flagellar hook-length control protein FliK n=1 Tax=Ferrovum sp. TaxID=2609467 RepID=UPI0026284501|nr:flagellar hook-length control protein FliK [Ferrovum sp.]
MMQPVPAVRSTPVSGANRTARSTDQSPGGESFTALLSQHLSDSGASAQRPQSVSATPVPVHGSKANPPQASEGRPPSAQGSRSATPARSGGARSQQSTAQTGSAPPPVEKKPSHQAQTPVTVPPPLVGGTIAAGMTATTAAANPGTNVSTNGTAAGSNISTASGTAPAQPAPKKPLQSALAGQLGVAAAMPSHVWMPPAKPEQAPAAPSGTAIEGALSSPSESGGAGPQGSVVQKNAEATSPTSGNEANFSLSVGGGNGAFVSSTNLEASGGPGSTDSSAVSLSSTSAHTAPGHSELNALLMSSGGTSIGAETPSSSVMVPVGQAGWGQEFSQKVTWMVGQSQQSAELHLNPPDLGPLSVVVQVSGAQADAFFSSPHAAVREAIQHALPHLREMLAGSGLSLGQATVSDQGARGSPSQRQMARENFSATKRTLEVSSVPTGVGGRAIRQGVGLVDTFA